MTAVSEPDSLTVPTHSDARALSSVANAARVLKEFRNDRTELGVSELGRRLRIGKSTAHRLVTTLVHEQLLEQDPQTGLYRLSVTMYELGLAVPLLKELHLAAAPVVEALRSRTKETVLVGVRRYREIVYVERSESSYGMALFRRLGYRNQVHCTTVGKVMLAEASNEEMEFVLDGWRMSKRTDRTITDQAAFRMELMKVRSQGYATCLGEADPTEGSVGVAIRAASGLTVACLTVVVPIERMSPQATHNLAQLCIEAASVISSRLAHAEAPNPVRRLQTSVGRPPAPIRSVNGLSPVSRGPGARFVPR